MLIKRSVDNSSVNNSSSNGSSGSSSSNPNSRPNITVSWSCLISADECSLFPLESANATVI